MVLCSRCASFDFDMLIERACSEANFMFGDYKVGYSRHEIFKGIRWATITQAAHSGCELCVLMLHGMLDLPNPFFR
jgi:hypothetical protein